MTRRSAIVIRGPMGVGKSEVANELCKRLMAGNKIILDEGWVPGYGGWPRHSGGPSRYGDIRLRTENCIVIELGCGEPLDLEDHGATRGAMEWKAVLDDEGRTVHCFQLFAKWTTISVRMKAKRRSELLMARLWFGAYENKLDVVSLPRQLQELERIIHVDAKTPQQVADEILDSVSRAARD